jgi:hypothetical protein
MAYAADTGGLSADSILTFEDLEVDPFYSSDGDTPLQVWKHSDYIRDLLKKRAQTMPGLRL